MSSSTHASKASVYIQHTRIHKVIPEQSVYVFTRVFVIGVYNGFRAFPDHDLVRAVLKLRSRGELADSRAVYKRPVLLRKLSGNDQEYIKARLKCGY